LTNFTVGTRWVRDNPHTLVVACSDGRFQQEVDEFLHEHLRISQYDRCYIPGGAGALVPGGVEFTRASQIRKECCFLIEAHGIERVVLLFHGPAHGGPEEAVCGDYKRRFPTKSAEAVRERQNEDAEAILRSGLAGAPVELYRCEVTENGEVQFVNMKP